MCDGETFSSVQQDKPYNYGHNILGASSPNVKDEHLAITDISSRARSVIPTSPGNSEKSSMSETSLTYANPPLTSSDAPGAPFHVLETNSRYALRNPQTNGFGNTPQTQSSYSPPKPQSEFRPHIADPSASDCVYEKMLDPLEDRDFEDGKLYIFDRKSSPGHVKIGWTAKSVSNRLSSWSTCGYTPNLLFATPVVPNAMRVETLTHYELIKQWRRERMCKAPWCGKSHQEWFEISRERAKQVVSHWAYFMEVARPYDKESGQLKPQWKEAIKKIYHMQGVVTAERLLGLYQATMINEESALHKPVDWSYTPKIKEEIAILHPEPMRFEGFKKENVLGNLPLMELPELSEDTVLVKKEVSKKEPKEHRLVDSKPSFRSTLIRKLAPTRGLGLVKKEFTPEEIPLPPSPSSEPASPHTTAHSSQCTEKGSSTVAEQPITENPVINQNTNACVLLSKKDFTVSTSPSSPLTSEIIIEIKPSADALYSSTNISSPELLHLSARVDSSDPPAKETYIKPKTEPVLHKGFLDYDGEAD